MVDITEELRAFMDSSEKVAIRDAINAERDAIVALVEGRAQATLKLAKRGTLTEAEATRLSRWLRVVASDIEADLHRPDEA